MNMMRRITFELTITAALLALIGSISLAPAAAAQDAADDAVDFRPLWQTGQVSRYEMTSTMISTQTMSIGGASTSTIKMLAEVTWRVLEANEAGGGRCELIIDHVELEIIGPDGTMQRADEDRGDAGAEMFQQMAAGMTDVAIDVDVSPAGRIESVTGWEMIRDNAGPIGGMLTESDFRELAYELAPLAGGAADVAPGAQWDESFQFESALGRIDQDSQYEFVGTELLAGVPVAMVNRRSALDLTPDLSDMPEGLPPLEMTVIEAKQTSQIMFDMSRHEVVGQNIDKVLEVHVSVTLPDRQITTTTRQVTNGQTLRIAEE